MGDTVELKVLDVPTHTRSHVCLLAHADQPDLCCGDILFNASAGDCQGSGHKEFLYDTCVDQFSKLDDEILVYLGHEDTENNLEFMIDCEPSNSHVAELLTKFVPQDPHELLVATLALETEISTFFLLQSPAVIPCLREGYPDFLGEPSAKEVSVILRTFPHNW